MNTKRKTYFQDEKSDSLRIKNLKFEYNYFFKYVMIWHWEKTLKIATL